MKKSTNFFGAFKKVLCLALVFAFTITLSSPITASAKTVKANAQPHRYNSSVLEADSVATPIKTGTNKVQVLNNDQWFYGYLKFTAPKTKTYTIKVSDIKTNKKKAICLGSVDIYGVGAEDMLQMKTLQTKGKDKTCMQLCNRKYKNYIPTRTAKLSLQAGETIYIYYNFVGVKNGSKMTSKLSIK